MKKIISIFSGIVIALFCVSTAYAAIIQPGLFAGNDSNRADYIPPTGYIHYEIPDSANEGTHTVLLNSYGLVDPAGEYVFTVVVGSGFGESYTKVLSWTSNFPLYSVIAYGGNAFHQYLYESTARNDTDLVAPLNAEGQPADLGHVSIVFLPATLSCNGSPVAIALLTAGISLSTLGLLGWVLLIVPLAILVITLILVMLIAIKLFRLTKPPKIKIRKTKVNNNINIDVDKNTNIDIDKNINVEKKIIIKNEEDCRNNWRNPCK